MSNVTSEDAADESGVDGSLCTGISSEDATDEVGVDESCCVNDVVSSGRLVSDCIAKVSASFGW